jgi:hypothetical protein
VDFEALLAKALLSYFRYTVFFFKKKSKKWISFINQDNRVECSNKTISHIHLESHILDLVETQTQISQEVIYPGITLIEACLNAKF